MKPALRELSSTEEWNNSTQSLTKESSNKLILNYLIGAGFKDAAEQFTRESNTLPPVNDCALAFRARIIETIRKGNALQAMDMVESCAPGLLEKDRWITCRLQQLHLIELIRADAIADALRYAQTVEWNCEERSQEMRSDVERTLALLAFPTPQTSPFAVLLEQNHRELVAGTVNEALLRYGNQELRLELLFKLIHWAETEFRRRRVPITPLKNIPEAGFKAV